MKRRLIIVCLMLLMVAMATATVQANLVGHWSFDGSLDGATVVSGNPQFVSGAVGQAIQLNGTNDALALGSSSALQPAEITVAFWIKRTADMSNKENLAIWSKGDTDWAGNGWFLTLDARGAEEHPIKFWVDGYNIFHTVGSINSTFPLDEWVHVAATFSSITKEMAIYRNGIPQPFTVVNQPSTITATGNITTYLGFNGPTWSAAWAPAAFDDVRIYDRVLSAQEIAVLANNSVSEGRWHVPVYTASIAEPQFEMRTWNLVQSVPGMPQQFTAALVGIDGFDSERSKEYIVVQEPNGRRRGIPLTHFSTADQNYARTKNEILLIERAIERSQSNLGNYISGAPVQPGRNTVTSKYFRFIYGNDQNGSGSRWFDLDFREMVMEYYDMVFEFFVHELGFHPPYGDEATKYKIDVLIFGTGIGDGWAFGGDGIWIHPEAMLEGSSVIPHEFGHVLQFYSGGFRNSPVVGWVWESHANWLSNQIIPDYPPVIGLYSERSNHYLTSTRFNYGSWPIFQFIAEQPDLGPEFVNRIWTEALRANPQTPKRQSGSALEDPLQAIMRIGFNDGKFTHPEQSFGDLVGQMAAHNATWDYVYQYPYENAAPPTRHNRTILEEVPDRPGWYRPPYSMAPQAYGYNVVELEIAPQATQIQINLEGVPVDSVADWRATIVVVDSQGRARYSPMTNGGTVAINVSPSDVKAYLTVAATPLSYTPINLESGGFRAIIKYPYEVLIHGATPVAKPVDYPAPSGQPHPNGGGYVASTAYVAPTAYVGPNAIVLGNAQVTGNARIEGFSVVKDSANVSGNAIVTGYSLVRHNAKVGGNAFVRNAEVAGDVSVIENARVIDNVYVDGPGIIRGNATLTGRGTVHTYHSNGYGTIGGHTIVGLNSEYHSWTTSPITNGIYTEFTNSSNHPWDVPSIPAYLYAHWDFNEPNAVLLKDKNFYNDGFLRGNPQFVTDSGRQALSFNGSNQYVVVDRDVSELIDMTIDVWVKWEGNQAHERIFDFGSDSQNSMYLTPRGSSGRVEFVMTINGVQQRIIGTSQLPNTWTRVRVILSNGVGKLYVGNTLVGQSNIAFKPVQLGAKSFSNYIGRSQNGAYYFTGKIDDFKVYTSAIQP